MSVCEEKILESLAWQSTSPLWSHLKRAKLNATLNTNTLNQLSQLDIAFPLFEDVNIFTMGNSNNSSVLLSSNQYPKITTTTTTSNNNNNNNNNNASTTTSQINTADFLNTNTTSFSSPIKQAPTITRVVCSADSSPLKINSILSQQQTSSTLTNTLSINMNSMQAGSVVTQARLKNVTKYTACFFRKFYNLANTRLRTLMERLELAQSSVELFLNNQQQNNKDVS
jgi:hypothetical protein